MKRAHGEQQPSSLPEKTTKQSKNNKSIGHDSPVLTAEENRRNLDGTITANDYVMVNMCDNCKEYLPQQQGDVARRIGTLCAVWLCYNCKSRVWSRYIQHE